MKKCMFFFLMTFLAFKGNAQVKAEIDNTTPETEMELESELEKLLDGLTIQEIKNGIKDPGVDQGKLMKEILAEQLAKKLAQALTLAIPAVTSYAKFKKKKEKELAGEISDTRDEYVKAFDELEKITYNTLKLRMERHLYNSTVTKSEFEKKFNIESTNSDLSELKKYKNTLAEENTNTEKEFNKKFTSSINDNSVAEKRIKLAKKTGTSVHLSSYDRVRLIQSIDKDNENKKKLIIANKYTLSEKAKKKASKSAINNKSKQFTGIK